MAGTMSEEGKKAVSEKMLGNKNGVRRNKPFFEMLDRAIKQDPKKLQRIVNKVISDAEEGDSFSINLIADRLDGKAIAVQEISGPDGNPIEVESADAFAKELVAELLRGRQKEQDSE